jgi:hypothetical protein
LGGPQAGAETGLSVVLAPFLFIIGARQAIEKLLSRKIQRLFHHVLFVSPQGDLSHLRNDAADCISIGADREILMRQDIFEPQSIDDGKRAFEKGHGDLKADEIVILMRGISILRHLHHVKAELRLEMRGMIFCVSNGIPVLGAKFRVLEGNGQIDGGMSDDIRGVVCQSTEGEGVLVGILALQEQLSDEIAAANVVN